MHEVLVKYRLCEPLRTQYLCWTYPFADYTIFDIRELLKSDSDDPEELKAYVIRFFKNSGYLSQEANGDPTKDLPPTPWTATPSESSKYKILVNRIAIYTPEQVLTSAIEGYGLPIRLRWVVKS